jgi:hypothetical protein
LLLAILLISLILAPGMGFLESDAQAQDPDCVPDATGACHTFTPAASSEPPAATPTSESVPTRQADPSVTPLVQPSLTATGTALPFLAAPANTPTPFGFRLPLPPEENPFRSPEPPITLPIPTATQINDLALDFEKRDLEVYAAEVTQGIQDMQNRMPLVQYRGTVIRLYVRTDAGEMYGVRGAVEAYRDGQKLAGSPLFASNQPIAAHAAGPDRLKVEDTLNFEIYQDWRVGDVTFKFFAYPVDPSYPYLFETNAENNFYETTVEFHPGSFETVVMPSIHMHSSDDKGVIDPNSILDYAFDATAGRDAGDVVRYYPVSNVVVIADVDKIYPEDHTVDDHKNDWTLDKNQDDVLAKIQLYRDVLDNPYPDALWHGMLSSDVTWKWGGFSNGVVSMGKINAVTLEDSPTDWYVNGGFILVHENGHNLGRDHVACGAGEGSPDPNYPYPGDPCSLAAVDPEGFYGYDWYWDLWPQSTGPTVISNEPTEAEPNQGFPMMSYRSPKWIDPYTYCAMMPIYGVDCSLADIGMAALPDGAHMASLDLLVPPSGGLPSYLQQAQEFLRVYGSINKLTNAATFTNVVRTAALTSAQQASVARHQAAVERASEHEAGSSYSLSLEDAAGNNLFMLPLYDLSSAHGESDTVTITEVVPFVTGAAYVRVRSGSDVIAERPISLNAPVVRMLTQNEGGAFTAPVEISWEGSDADGDPLSYLLQYTPDGGQTWKVLLMDLRTTNVRLESFDGLPGGSDSYFRITANDGVNASSDMNDAPFSVPDSAPSALIFTPVDNAAYPQGSTLRFTGQGTDPEDGVLNNAALVWSSDRDGDLGTSNELITDALSPGLHKITLRASDHLGQSGEFSIFVTMDPGRALELPSQAEKDAVAGIFNGVIPQAPVEVSAPRISGVIWIALAILGLLVVGAIAFMLLRRPGRA